MGENVVLSCPDYSKLLCDGIWEHFSKKRWTDMMIGGNGYEVGVHRLIFSIFSSHFPTQSSDWKLDGVSSDLDAVSTVLEFAYKGEINVMRQRLDKVKEGAEALGFKLLVDAIDSYISQEQTPKTKVINKRKHKTARKSTNKLRSGNINQPSTSGLSLRKKTPVNYVEEEDDDDGDLSSADLPLLENAILIELEDDDEDLEDEDDYGFQSQFYLSTNKRMKNRVKKSFDGEEMDKATLECGSCEFVSNDWEILRKHYQTSHSKHSSFTYTCSDCDFVCDKKLVLTRHVHKEHSQDRPYKCEKCDYRGKTLSSLRSHSEMHSDSKFTCSVCDQKFTLSCSLHRHMKLHLTTEKKNVCHLCPSKYRRLWDLKVHLRQVHNVEPPTTPKCFPTTARASRKFSCPHCDYEGWEQIRYINHLAIRHHLDPQGNQLEPKHKCDHCDFAYFTKSQLSSHTDRVHSDKTFPCPECDYVSPRKADLNQHVMRKHSEQKHFMCETCGFLCATQRYLARHQETHQGNQLICGVCNMKFTLKSSLKRHGKLHMTDEKPFGCHLCTYSSRKRYNLKCHLKRIHKVDLGTKESVEQLIYQVL